MSTEPVIAGPGDNIVSLLEAGCDVITTAELPLQAAEVVDACQRGGSTLYAATVAGAFMVERVIMTMIQGLYEVRHIEVTIAEPGDPSHAATIVNVSETLFADRDVRIEREPGIHRAYRHQQHFLTINHGGKVGPYGPFGASRGYAIRVSGEPNELNAQWEVDGTITAAQLIRDAIPAVKDAGPGILTDDPAPRYRLDERVEAWTEWPAPPGGFQRRPPTGGGRVVSGEE